jgi:hypothetical protein
MGDPMDEVFAGIPRASDVFELVKTLEFDHPTAGPRESETVSIRIRLFRSTSDPQRFRCRLSRLESWTLRPTFRDSPDDGESDEEVDSGWDHMLTRRAATKPTARPRPLGRGSRLSVSDVGRTHEPAAVSNVVSNG